jgi:hypothetical protein
MPYSIIACVYTLANLKQPAWTYKSTKKENLSTEHTNLGELTKNLDHAWPRVRPNTYLILAYKRRVRGPIWRRRIRVKKLYPIAHSHCPYPLAILVQREIQTKEVGGHLKRSPGSGSRSSGLSRHCKELDALTFSHGSQGLTRLT